MDLRDQEYGAATLAVDLDGTLLRSDTLHEGFVRALFTRPLDAVMAAAAIVRGRAAVKARLSDHSSAAVEHIPVHADFLAWLHDMAQSGRSLHLVTAAHHSVAAAAAQRFPIFDRVIATEGETNLKGVHKRDRLTSEFPEGFAYAGDSSADLPIFAHAESIVVVGTDEGVKKRALALGRPVEAEFSLQGATAKDWLKALRIHQWSKNLLMFVPLFLSGAIFHLDTVFTAVLGFVLMGVAASGTYILNDLSDLDADRRHWSKSGRPFASGLISPLIGLLAAVTLIVGGLAGSLLLSPAFAAALLLYLATTLGYSFWMKRVPLLDVGVLAALYTLRLAMGAVLAQVLLSEWLVVFSLFFFLSLSLAKRHVEVLRAGEHYEGAIPGRGYRTSDTVLTLPLGLSAAMTSLLLMVIFLVFEAFQPATYARPHWLWAAPAMMFLWLSRIWLLASRGELEDDPVSFAVKDKTSIVLGIVLSLAVLLAILPSL